jgi:hypothetical protein
MQYTIYNIIQMVKEKQKKFIFYLMRIHKK